MRMKNVKLEWKPAHVEQLLDAVATSGISTKSAELSCEKREPWEEIRACPECFQSIAQH